MFRWLLCVLVSSVAIAGPKPGDIFKTFTFVPLHGHFAELDPHCPRKQNPDFGMRDKPHRVVQKLNLDLNQAIRAEFAVEYWGGHIGTSEQRVSINGNEWLDVPQPHNTPGEPQCYYRTILGNETLEIPLSWLKDECNEFRFTCGSQICHNFNWGFYWIYSFTVYVYYNKNVAHPEGEIIFPVEKSVLGDNPAFAVRAASPNGRITRVDYIGNYLDFDWDGNGIFKEWQYQTNWGALKHHIGFSDCAPYEVEWQNQWIPDQAEPFQVMAMITDETGMSTMTKAVGGLTLLRPDRTVRMITSMDVPEKFGVRVGARMSCTFDLKEEPDNIRAARLIVSTWSAAHGDEIGINDVVLWERLGRVHDYSFDSVGVPVQHLRQGENNFYIYAETHHHALEVNWPGPVLLVESEL